MIKDWKVTKAHRSKNRELMGLAEKEGVNVKNPLSKQLEKYKKHMEANKNEKK